MSPMPTWHLGLFLSTDSHNSLELHPSRKSFPSANLNPAVSTLPCPGSALEPGDFSHTSRNGCLLQFVSYLQSVHPARATIQPSNSSIPFLLLNLGRPACYSPECLSQQTLACLPLLAPFTLSPEGSFEGSLDRPFSFLPGRFRPGRKGPDF